MKDRWHPSVCDQDQYADWVQKGKKDIITRAKEKIREILETHKVKPLTAKEEQTISDIMKEAREYYRKKDLIPEDEWSVYRKTLKKYDCL